MNQQTKHITYILAYCLCCVSLCMACAHTPYVYKVPTPRADGLLVASAKQHATLASSLQTMVHLTRKGTYRNIHSVLLIKDGKLLLDEYFHGRDETRRHDLRSATKSITSLLVGIGIKQGWIKSINQYIAPLLPRYQSLFNKDPRKKKIQIKHLLTMSSGLACNDAKASSPGQEDKMYRTKDWLGFLFQAPMVRKPGEEYAYCTGGVVALGKILQNTSKMPFPALAQKYLFTPLGITDAKWSPSLPKGTTDTGGHLYLRPRDLAKIGLLVLQKGKWNGKEIVPEDWLKQSFTMHNSQVGYGYLWWLRKGRSNTTGNTLPIHYASGNGGQYLMILPTLRAIVVFTGGNYNSPLARQPFLMLGKHVLKPLLR